jgi:hypothetical protein
VKPDETLLRPSLTHLLRDGAPAVAGPDPFVGLEINRAGMIAAAGPTYFLMINMEAL